MTTVDELYQLLEEKENDLQLAAELGKALLERNEALTKEHDKSCKDFHNQIEQLKSENMWMRGQLSKHSDEWEEVMKEHNDDIQQLREQLTAKAKQFSQQTQSLQEITQLAQQNQRLSAELDKVLESEELLKLSHSELKLQLEELRTENDSLSQQYDDFVEKAKKTKRKLTESEQKISLLANQNEKLNKLCDELGYKNGNLEKEKLEVLEQIRVSEKQIEILKDKNSELFEQIQELANKSALTSPSFLEELEYSQKSLTSGYSSNLSLLDELDSDEAITMLPVDNFSQLKMEVLDTYQELQAIIEELEFSECATGDQQAKPKVTTSKEISNGELISTAKHVKYLVTRRHQIGSLLAQIAELKSSVTEKAEKIDNLECELGQAKKHPVSTETEQVVSKLKQEKADMETTLSKIKDELNRTKADNRKLEKELLETIQKKIKLSQQVEQWQLDMEEMVENQVRCMFLLEQKNKGETLTVHSSPSAHSLSTSAATAASPQQPVELKQKSPFNRSDKRRFSLFRRNKD